MNATQHALEGMLTGDPVKRRKGLALALDNPNSGSGRVAVLHSAICPDLFIDLYHPAASRPEAR